MSKRINIDETTYNYCYWCGGEIIEKVEWDEYYRSVSYSCSCQKAQKVEELTREIDRLNDRLKSMKRENSALEREYEIKLENLKKEFGRN